MVGAVIIVLVVVVFLPVTLMMSGAVASAVIGWAAKGDAEARHEGSELIDLS
jgi:hypothetical protein